MITEDELLTGIRQRISNPHTRLDLQIAGIPQLFGTAAIQDLDAVEADLGFALPSLLRRLYSEVANGGFGPGAGLLGVNGGYLDLDGRTLSGAYQALRIHGWPVGVLPLCELGGGARSCVDMRVSGDSMLTVDAAGVTRTNFSLFSSLQAWVSGIDMEAETFEIKSGTITNPFTHKAHSVKQRGRAKGVLLEPFSE